MFLMVSISSKAQICNFCSEQDLRESLKGEKVSLQEKINVNGDKSLIESNENYSKCWHFKYGQCYMYEVKVLNSKYFRSMKKILNSQFTATSDTTWEDMENKVQLKVGDGYKQFVFIPKFSSSQKSN